MDARMLDQDLARAVNPSRGWEWIVGVEEDWSGVYDCGAICVPDREMHFEIDDEDWPMRDCC